MNNHLCLKWNNHSSAFIKSISSVQLKEKYCDATIVCQGKYYAVHRFILSTCSEYFEEMFERIQSEHPYIVFRDVEPVDMELLLNYMYQGEINVVQERLPTLIKTAEALKIKGLAVPDEVTDNEYSPGGKKRSKNSNDSFIHSRKKSRGRYTAEQEDISESIRKDHETSHSNQENVLLPASSIKKEIDESSVFEERALVVSEDSKSDFPNTKLESQLEEPGEEIGSGNSFPNTEEEFDPDTYSNSMQFWANYSDLDNSQNLPPRNGRQETSVTNREESVVDPQINGEGVERPGFYQRDETFPSSFNKGASETPSSSFKSHSLGYKINALRNLKLHSNSRSSQDKPFQCHYCFVRFHKKAYLTVHLRMHTGERPYRCQVCSMKFSTKSNLNRHKKSFHSQNAH